MHSFLPTRAFRYVCTGILLTEIWVLTAGHCVEKVNSRPRLATVTVGMTDMNNRSYPVQSRSVSKVILHEGFRRIVSRDGKDTVHRNDLALLQVCTFLGSPMILFDDGDDAFSSSRNL